VHHCAALAIDRERCRLLLFILPVSFMPAIWHMCMFFLSRPMLLVHPLPLPNSFFSSNYLGPVCLDFLGLSTEISRSNETKELASL
jgi:hypothetical protein